MNNFIDLFMALYGPSSMPELNIYELDLPALYENVLKSQQKKIC